MRFAAGVVFGCGWGRRVCAGFAVRSRSAATGFGFEAGSARVGSAGTSERCGSTSPATGARSGCSSGGEGRAGPVTRPAENASKNAATASPEAATAKGGRGGREKMRWSSVEPPIGNSRAFAMAKRQECKAP